VITAPPPETTSDKWNNLSQTAKTAIYASGAGVGAILVALMAFYCIRQRRRGAKQARIAEAKAEEERRELAAFKAAGVNPDSFSGATGAEYNAKEMAREGITSKDSYSVPVSPSSPDHMNEKWQTATAVGASAGFGAAAAGAARSNMPLLHEGAQSPRITSPPPQNSGYDRSIYNSSPAGARSLHGGAASPAPLISPMRSASPAMPPQQHGQQFQQQQFQQHPSRSFSSPNAQMRVGSPGPQQAYGMQPSQNPNPMMAPQPHRSFTTGGYPPQTGGGYGAGGGVGYGNGQSNQYWGNNNYR
jgi:hypothetical protein